MPVEEPIHARARVALAALAVVAVGCGGHDDHGGASPDAGGGPPPVVHVELREYAIDPSAGSVAAGAVTFHVVNAGAEPHELVVYTTEDDVLELPTRPDGSLDARGLEPAGAAHDVAPGESAEIGARLEPGRYALVCNVVEKAHGHGTHARMSHAHFALGMRTTFTVE